jgi:hypothetical protein
MTGASPFRAEPAAAIIDRFNTAWTTHDLDAALALTSENYVPGQPFHCQTASAAPAGQRSHLTSRSLCDHGLTPRRQIKRIWALPQPIAVQGLASISGGSGAVRAQHSVTFCNKAASL